MACPMTPDTSEVPSPAWGNVEAQFRERGASKWTS
jgi:hypothetical protein